MPSDTFVRNHAFVIRRRILLSLLIVTLLPILFSTELWQGIWTGVRPFAWDGAGHYTLAQIYSDTIFPDVFGWTNGFFAGMPHPNNYPPLFYWLVALLAHSHLFSFATAFKIVIVLPTLLLPAATWLLAWKTSAKNEPVAFCAALSIAPLLVDHRFFITSGPLGITYLSTFVTGLYSHPLGYLFLILWFAAYSGRRQPLWRVALSALLLAGSFLSSFFGASVTVIVVGVTLIHDVLQLRGAARDADHERDAIQTLIGHLVSPVVAFCLALFWLAPVIAARDYIVTQPSSVPLGELLPPPVCIWYAVAGIGALLWLLSDRRFGIMSVYFTTCVILAIVVFFAPLVTPPWFPLHPTRLIATLNFLLALPIGITLAFGFGQLAQLLGIAPLLEGLHNRFAVPRTRESVNQPFEKLTSTLR